MAANNLASVSSAENEEKSTKVSLELLAKMTGFPVEMIQEELFQGQQVHGEVYLEELRSAMLTYIDSTILVEEVK